mgnify:CR=1 FL=1
MDIIEGTLAGLLVHNDPRKVDFSLPAQPILVDVDGEKLSLALVNVLLLWPLLFRRSMCCCCTCCSCSCWLPACLSRW